MKGNRTTSDSLTLPAKIRIHLRHNDCHRDRPTFELAQYGSNLIKKTTRKIMNTHFLTERGCMEEQEKTSKEGMTKSTTNTNCHISTTDAIWRVLISCERENINLITCLCLRSNQKQRQNEPTKTLYANGTKPTTQKDQRTFDAISTTMQLDHPKNATDQPKQLLTCTHKYKKTHQTNCHAFPTLTLRGTSLLWNPWQLESFDPCP